MKYALRSILKVFFNLNDLLFGITHELLLFSLMRKRKNFLRMAHKRAGKID